MRVGKRLVFVNPTVIPTMCFKVRRLERGWFSQIQLSIEPLPLMYEGWKTVGFRQSIRHSNPSLRYEGWNAVGFRKTSRHSNRGL